MKEILFPDFSDKIDTSNNKFNGFVDVYLEKSTGQLILGKPYMDIKDRPDRVEYDVHGHRYIGTANISFSMPFKPQSKFRVGDKILMFSYQPATIISINEETCNYTVRITEEDMNYPGCPKIYSPGIHQISFDCNGQIIKLK